MKFATDHWAAAGFVEDDFDNIVNEWHGTEQEMRFLTGFIRHFGHRGTIPCPY